MRALANALAAEMRKMAAVGEVAMRVSKKAPRAAMASPAKLAKPPVAPKAAPGPVGGKLGTGVGRIGGVR